MKDKNIKFLYQENGNVKVMEDKFDVESNLKPGFYRATGARTMFGDIFNITTDETVKIPKGSEVTVSDNLPIAEILKYFSEESKNIHDELNMKLKMGVLLHGKQGTGKTTMCYALAQTLIESHQAVVFTVTNFDGISLLAEFINRVNPKLEKPLFSIIIMDECEDIMDRREGEMKTLLDSSTSPENCLLFFTTNYIDEVPKAIKDRPSRIKYCLEIKGIEDEVQIYSLLKGINDNLSEGYRLDTQTLKTITPGLIGSTIDEIKHKFLDEAYKFLMDSRVYAQTIQEQLV